MNGNAKDGSLEFGMRETGVVTMEKRIVREAVSVEIRLGQVPWLISGALSRVI